MGSDENNHLAIHPFSEVGASVAPPVGRKQSLLAMQQLVRTEDLTVVFQPILRLSTMKIFAYEALLRCSVPAYSNPMVLVLNCQ